MFADNNRPVTVQGERGGFGFSFVSPPAEGVLSVKRKLTFMLGPQMRPVLSVGRFLGAAGMQSSSEMKAAPHRSSRPPAPSVGRRYSMCAWICVSYTCLRQRWSPQRPNPQALLCWWMWKHADAPNSPERGNCPPSASTSPRINPHCCINHDINFPLTPAALLWQDFPNFTGPLPPQPLLSLCVSLLHRWHLIAGGEKHRVLKPASWCGGMCC